MTPAPRIPWPGRWPRSYGGPWLLVAVALLRASGFFLGLVDPDEAHFLVIGRMLGEGAIPYVDVVDKKPLFTYLFYAPAALFGFHMWPMQVLGVLWVFATCVVLGRAAELWTGRREAGFAAAWLYALISSCGNLAIHAEMMLNLPAAGALLCFVRAARCGRRRDDFYAGLCVGLAALFRHQAAILLPALMLAYLWQGRGSGAGRHLRLLAGFALPWAGVVAAYAALGQLPAFYDWNVRRNLSYVVAGSSGGKARRLLLSVLLYVVCAAPLPWLLALRAWRPPLDPVRVGPLLAVWLTWVPVCLSGRFYSQYFVQFAAPLALLAAPPLLALWERRGSRALLCAALLAPLALWLGYEAGRRAIEVVPYPGRDPRAAELGRWLREHTRPDERLFVWGRYPPIYYLAQRLPGTRYVTTGVHIGDFELAQLPADFDPAPYVSQRDVAITLQDLEAHRTAIVVDTAPTDLDHWARFPLARVPALDRYVRAHYALVARPAGALVYRRID